MSVHIALVCLARRNGKSLLTFNAIFYVARAAAPGCPFLLFEERKIFCTVHVHPVKVNV